MKTTLKLNGLDCPHCAGKIEAKVKSDSRFENVGLNFITKELTLEHSLSEEKLIGEVSELVDSVEDGIKVTSKTAEEPEPENSTVGILARAIAVLVLIVLYAVCLKSGKNSLHTAAPALIIIAYLIAGGDVILRAVKNLTKGRVFDENFLMSIATIGAIILGEYSEALAVMVFYQIGEFFQDRAVDNSKRSIGELIGLKVDTINKLDGKEVVPVLPEEVEPGDILVIKSGEKIPVDGILTEGSTVFDTSALTGESLPFEVNEGDKVLSGCINNGSAIKIKAESRYNDSTAAKIARMAENAAANKAKAETFISAFARIYTPAVVILALLLAAVPCLISGFDVKWIYRGLIFLVASCPCALVLSVPLCFFSGIGKASKQGVLIKGSNYIQALSKIKLMAFDKTGTLTTGDFTVTTADKKALMYAASLEQYSSHPIAKAVTAAYDGELLDMLDIEEKGGFGLIGKHGSEKAAVGSKGLMDMLNIPLNGSEGDIYVAVDGCVIGTIKLNDTLKPDSATTVLALEAIAIKTAMITGDKKEKAVEACRELGINILKCELLPDQKLEAVKELKKKYGSTAFVGDGINDAPVLAGADVGIAMGGIGSDAAIEAADMVIMGDNPAAALRAAETSKRTMSVLWQNVIFILVVKAAILLLTVFGLSNMWLAVFADVGTALIAVLNSARILE